jgi:signal peptidase I
MREFLKMIALFLVLFFALKFAVIEGYTVQGESMEPALASHDRILVLKLPHLLSRWGLLGDAQVFDADDIIVFESPENPGRRYVKRLAAQGPPVGSRNKAIARGRGESEDGVPVQIVDGRLYVNNHAVKTHNAEGHGFDPRETTGKVLLGPGEYYVLGDNLAVSKDSRSFSAVHDRAVIGKAVFRLWPLSKFGPIE